MKSKGTATIVRPKKQLGQHFLNDESIARRIVESLQLRNEYKTILEVGPGMGVLTKYLLEDKEHELFVIDIDKESIDYLQRHFAGLKGRIIEGDFLQVPLLELKNDSFAIIGNFPYNISSQILFRTLEFKDRVPELVGMFQKEVAERLAAKPRSKAYGILTILIQAVYKVEYLFTVDENVFIPPPKVKSGVVRLTRLERSPITCDPVLFTRLVKAGFNQRRKTLRNALKSFPVAPDFSGHVFFSQRAEELSIPEWVQLTDMIHSELLKK